MRGAIPLLIRTSSWCGAQLSTGTTLPYQALSYLTRKDKRKSRKCVSLCVGGGMKQGGGEATKMGSHPSEGYKYRGLVLRDGGWAWG
jgi:hypothetical protein